MGTIHYLQPRHAPTPGDHGAPVVVTAHGFSLGNAFVAWQAVAEIRAWKCDRIRAEEAFIGFFVGDACIAVSEACLGFCDMEAAMIAAFPGTVRWRSAVALPRFERNETVLYRRG